MSSWKLPRRTLLKGLGCSLLLPMLDAMVPTSARANPTPLPARFIAMFLNLGIYGQGYDPTKNDASRYPAVNAWDPGGSGVWVPAKAGAFGGVALPPALTPLEALKGKVAVLSGLGTLPDDPANNSVNHSAATSSWSTSAWKSSAEATQINILSEGSPPVLTHTKANETPPSSIDQHIANALNITPGTTLALSGGNYDFSETGQGGHGGAISYNSALSAGGSSLLPRTQTAQKAFDNVFGSCSNDPNAKAPDQKSLLDYVSNDIKSVQKKLGAQDKARLDSYFQNIRDLEKKITLPLPCPDPLMPDTPLTGGDYDHITNLEMMIDVIALAVTSGAMPIATFMSSSEADGSGWAHAGVDALATYVGINGKKVGLPAGIDMHGEVSHVEYAADRSNPASIAAIERHIAFTQMNMHFVMRLMAKLDSMMPADPGGLTELDKTIILVGAAHSDSGVHNTHNIPTLLAGGKGFGIAQGQHLAYPMNSDLGDLHYTLSKALGVPNGDFNGHKTLLPGVFTKVP